MFVRALLVVCFITSVAVGQTRGGDADYPRVDLKNFVVSPASYENTLVSVTAEVVSVRADYASLTIFDGKSRTLVVVSLTKLPEAKRQELINGPARRITVMGKLELLKGRPTITAEKVILSAPETLASN